MTQPINFSNFGYMFDTIPEHLFKKIKEESSRLEFENSRMVSGLTGNGVAKHFYMNENYQREFVEYVMHLKDVYLNTYKDYLSMFRCFSNSVPFVCDKPWYNIQRKYEFVPNHTHDGFLSYTAWLQVPYDSATETSNGSSYASCFEFTYVGATGTVLSEMIPVDKSYEGKIIMFPSAFTHCVYPFYTSDSTRISIAGNILFDTIKSKI
jgi:hypothetical protein